MTKEEKVKKSQFYKVYENIFQYIVNLYVLLRMKRTTNLK